MNRLFHRSLKNHKAVFLTKEQRRGSVLYLLRTIALETIISCQSGNRYCCKFQTKVEHQEITGGNHEIHPDQCRKNRIKNSLILFSFQVSLTSRRLKKNNQHTDIQDVLHHGCEVA